MLFSNIEARVGSKYGGFQIVTLVSGLFKE